MNKSFSTAIALTVLAGCSTNTRAPQISLGQPVADSVRMLADISYLASDRLEGRLTGTPGNDSAAAYIAKRFAALKLKAPQGGYLQKFVARSAAAAHTGDTAGKPTQNVVGIIEGSDPALRGEYVVIGAHHDHLGRSTVSALDPDARDAIRNGADDNASGTAAGVTGRGGSTSSSRGSSASKSRSAPSSSSRSAARSRGFSAHSISWTIRLSRCRRSRPC